MQEAEELQKRFASFSDRKLGEMILLHAGDYRPEALDIAKQEMVKRKLTLEALKVIIDSPAPMPSPEECHILKAPRIRGWLVLPGIGFVVTPLMRFPDIIDALFRRIDHPFTLFSGLVDIVLFVFCCILAVRFLKKKRNTPFLAVTFYLTALILDLVCGLFIYFDNLILNFSLWGYVKFSVIACVIWVPYFLLSKRVKRTFVID